MEQYSISIDDNTLEEIINIWCSLSKDTPAYKSCREVITNIYLKKVYITYKHLNKYIKVYSDGYIIINAEEPTDFNLFPEVHKRFKLKRRV